MKNKYSQHPLKLQGQYATNAQKIITRLHEIPRTGWVDRGVKSPETVGQHSDELVVLAERLFKVPGLSLILRIHDWAESDEKIGDRRTDNLCPPEIRWTKEQKYQAELEAMQNICTTLGSPGKYILSLWIEFEERKTIRAKLAYQLDKFQMIMKAIEYQKSGQPITAQEFIDTNGKAIENSILKRMMAEAQLGL